MKPVTELSEAIAHVTAGGRLAVPTHTRCTVIEKKHIDQWNAAGLPLLRPEGKGFRMRTGMKSSVYLLPGQLVMID